MSNKVVLPSRTAASEEASPWRYGLPRKKKHQALLLALAGAVVLLGLQLYLVTGFRPDDDEPVTDWVYMIGEGARKPRRVAVAEVAALLGAHKAENAVVPSEKRLAVVLAFRDVGVERWPHAALAIPYLHRYFRLLKLSYTIVLSEQVVNDKLFNRGMAFNVAFDQLKDQCDYIAFFDIDSFPAFYLSKSGQLSFVDVRYPRDDVPIHLGSEVQKFAWQLPYETFMGVATLFLRESYQAINGFSNNYYGWGTEDDDLWRRTNLVFGAPKRPAPNTGLFVSQPHKSADRPCDRLNRNHNNEWGQHFSTGQHNFTDDGLAQLNYSVLHREHNNQWGGYEWIVWDPQTPLLGNQRDRVPPEEIQKCFDRVRRAWLWA
jgi:hypothetical protein